MRSKAAVQISIIITFIIFFIELGSYAILYFLYDSSGPRHIQAAISKFHPIFSGSELSVAGKPAPPHQRRGKDNPFRVSTRTGYEFIPGKFCSTHLKIGPDGFICGIPCKAIPVKKLETEVRFLFSVDPVSLVLTQTLSMTLLLTT